MQPIESVRWRWLRVMFVGGLALWCTADRRTAPQAVSHNSLSAQTVRAWRVGMPLHFEPNVGQAGAGVTFLTRTGRQAILLSASEAVFLLPGDGRRSPERLDRAHRGQNRESLGGTAQASSIVMRLQGANPAARGEGLERLSAKANYFIGSDTAKWRTGIPTYARVAFREVYPGIDLVYYGTPERLEYDFVVRPGASPAAIRLSFQGAERTSLDEHGDLRIRAGGKDLLFHAPIVYQEAEGGREPICGRYILAADQAVGFEVGPYDRSRPVVIDPVLSFASYLGGAGDDYGFGVALDRDGNVFVCGVSISVAGAPRVPQALVGGGTHDAFVAKINPSTGTLVYATYLGGKDSEDCAGVAVDSNGNAYVAGTTFSTDFPVVNPYQGTSKGDYDLFLTKLSPSGATILYSTYLGGSRGDFCMGLALGSDSSVFLAGNTASVDFPTANALQGQHGGGLFDAFVTRLNSAGSGLVYSTYLGGSESDMAGAICTDSTGSAYVGGTTSSPDFPTLNPLQANLRGVSDSFVAKLAPTGAALSYSTYLGGTGDDYCYGIACDSSGNAYFVGGTTSRDFPVVNAFQGSHAGGYDDAFAAKLNASGTALLYATYLGGSDSEYARSVAVTSAGHALVTGTTSSIDFPLQSPVQGVFGGGFDDAFVTKLGTNGSSLVYSTYLGGSSGDQGNCVAIDASGSVYLAGSTSSTDFPSVNSIQPYGGGQYDAFLAKLTEPSELTVSSVVPSVAGDNGSFVFAIYGARFAAGATVKLTRAGQADIIGSSVVVEDSQTIEVTFDLSGKAVGAWDVVVTNPGGASATLAGGLTVEHGLKVQSVLPPEAENTQPVAATIRGFGFLAGATAKLARTGQADIVGTSVTVAPGGHTIQATFDITGKATGSWDVVVTNTDTTSATLPAGFQVAHTVTIQSVTPAKGSDTSSATVTIQGTGFVQGATAKLAKQGQEDIVGDPTVVTPDGTSLTTTFDLFGKMPGAWDVVVTNTDGSYATLPQGFVIEVDLAIYDIAPSKAWNVGVVTVFVRGWGFKAGATLSLDRAGTPLIPASWASVAENGRTIVAEFNLDSRAPGTYSLSVVNPDSRRVALRDAFVVENRFEVISVSPGMGCDRAAVELGIQGYGFDRRATVKLVLAGEEDIPGTSTIVSRQGRFIWAMFDLHGKKRGLWDVVVTNPNGASATLPGCFRISSMGLTGMNPSWGGDTGPVTIALYGFGFAEGATVKLSSAGQADIVARKVVVQPDGELANATFDLRGKPRGVWDLVLSNPDGSSITAAGSFTIEKGETGEVTVVSNGRFIVRTGWYGYFSFFFGNYQGNVDLTGTPAISGIPKGVDWDIVSPPPPKVNGQEISWKDVISVTEDDGGITVVFPTVVIPPVSSYEVRIRVKGIQDFALTGMWVGQ